MKTLYIFCISLLFHTTTFSQNSCGNPTDFEVTQGKYIQAAIHQAGTLFRYPSNNNQFNIPGLAGRKTDGQMVPLSYLTGISFIGVDPADNLVMAASSFGATDFFAGPIDTETGLATPESCQNWDKIWKVYRHQIVAHQLDFAADGFIDQPIAAIFNWPAHGNSLFEIIEGFPLPENSAETAPFFDYDGDGIYNPFNGDFPMPEGLPSSSVPEEITFCIYNDIGTLGNIHVLTGGEPIKLQVSQTTFTFNCANESPLNNTLFVALSLTNKRLEALDSTYFGILPHTQIGCGGDDYIGSAPDQNAFFVYNADNLDGDGTFEGCAGVNPPAQATIFLNKPFSKFMYYDYSNNDIAGPGSVVEYYKFLKGQWVDGSPLTFGGNGYQTGNPTDFAFPGNPNNPGEWSMLSEQFPFNNTRSVASSYTGTFLANETVKIDLAFTFVHNPEVSNLGNVTEMYAQIDEIQSIYDNNFNDACISPAICEQDCVWSGDANADGIVNHYDLLAIGRGLGKNGPMRNPPYSWTPQFGENWNDFYDSDINLKHADCDGNGEIDLEDIIKINEHYRLQNHLFESEPDEFQTGPELLLTPILGADLNNIQPGDDFIIRIGYIANHPDLYGIAFTVDFDPDFYNSIYCFPLGSITEKRIFGPYDFDCSSGQIDFATIPLDPELPVTESNYIRLQFFVKSDISGNSPTLTTQLRLKNIKGIDQQGMEFEIGANTLDFTFVNVNATKVAAENGFKIYPNPAGQSLNIDFSGKQIDALKIFDLTGRLIHENRQRIVDATQVYTGDLPDGIYFLQLENDTNTFFQKIMIKQSK